MANMFAEMAKKAVSNSTVREGRTNVSVDEIAKAYPDGITITEFDMLTVRDGAELKNFPTFAFEESPASYFNGGDSLKKIVTDWLAHFDGDIEACNAALKASGGCKIKIHEKIRTSNGNSFTPIEVLG